MTRSERFSIGYTYDEVTELEKAARALGLSVSEYIRSRALVDARSGGARMTATCAMVARKAQEEVMEMT